MFLTVVHTGFGSMVEGSEAHKVIGPFATQAEARSAGHAIYDGLLKSSLPSWYTGEIWTTELEIPDAPVQVAAVLAELIAEGEDE